MATDPCSNWPYFGLNSTTFTAVPGAFVPITEGTPAQATSVAYMPVATTTTQAPSDLGYVQYYTSTLQQAQWQQLDAMRNAFRDAMLYGQVSFRPDYEEPAKLESPGLSARDRADLDKDLPF